MDFELEDFISHLGEEEPFPGNQQMNELWKELEEYFDKELLDIDRFLDELLPSAQPVLPLMKNDIQVPETSAEISTEEFFRSFAITDSFYNDLIPEPKIDFKNKNLVPTEMLLKAVQSHKTMVNRNYPSVKLPSFLALSRNDVSENIEQNINCSKGSIIDWYKVLENIQLYPGITVESVINNILSESTAFAIMPSKEEIYISVSSLFKMLNSYIVRLTEEFTNYQFFDALQFHDISLKHQNEVLSLCDVQANLLEILTKWMTIFTEKFAHINEERRHIEEKVSEKIIGKAIKMYWSKLKSIDRNEEIVTQGIRQAYLNCGVDFNAKILTQLKERLKEVSSTPVQSLTSQTPEKSNISPQKSHALKNSGVLIKLLVSEYASNIKQKAVQCAGISTLNQFDDVNKNCLADIMKKFEREMECVPAMERNDFQKQFKLSLDSESNNKRSEFETLKLSASSGITSSYVQTRSQYVGIHFGFETLSVSYFNDGNDSFRCIYGPATNMVSFTPQGVFIGPPSVGCSLSMEQLFKTRNVDATHDTDYHGKLKLEAIIALVFMKIDEMVKQSLHTETRIKYAIAVPSCLNGVIQNTFKMAMIIGNIEGNLVFEPCALSAHFIRENHQLITKNNDEFLITLIADSHLACDAVIFKMSGENGRIIEISKISGSDATTGLISYWNKPGMQFELQRIKGINDKRNRFLICGLDNEISKQIKNQFSKVKVHHLNVDSSKLAEGAAILSSIANRNSKFECSFDLGNLTAIPARSNQSYRLQHYGLGNAEAHITQISAELHSLLEKQSNDFIKCKASTKQLIFGKMKDLELSTLQKDKKQSYATKLRKDLQTVEKEICSEVVIMAIADTWRKQFF